MKAITKKLLLPLLSLCTLAGLSSPASAAIQRSADFQPGHNVGIGIYGLSYDYGIGFFSAGLAVQSPASGNLSNPLYDVLKPSLRLATRFYQHEGLSAQVLGGVHFDPGRPGDRAYLTPDLGMGVAYDFRHFFNLPFALRMNLTLAISDRPSNSYGYGPCCSPNSEESSQPAPNIFQRLSFGPQTSLELAWLATDNLEVTLGGGTFLGMRLKF